MCPQTARSAQHKTQTKRDKRQIQVANNRGQVTNCKAASRQEARVTRGEGTNTDPQQPALARPNPSQDLNRTCPSRPNRTDYFGRPGPNQPCAPDRIGPHWFAAANNRPRQWSTSNPTPAKPFHSTPMNRSLPWSAKGPYPKTRFQALAKASLV